MGNRLGDWWNVCEHMVPWPNVRSTIKAKLTSRDDSPQSLQSSAYPSQTSICLWVSCIILRHTTPDKSPSVDEADDTKQQSIKTAKNYLDFDKCLINGALQPSQVSDVQHAEYCCSHICLLICSRTQHLSRQITKLALWSTIHIAGQSCRHC